MGMDGMGWDGMRGMEYCTVLYYECAVQYSTTEALSYGMAAQPVVSTVRSLGLTYLLTC